MYITTARIKTIDEIYLNYVNGKKKDFYNDVLDYGTGEFLIDILLSYNVSHKDVINMAQTFKNIRES